MDHIPFIMSMIHFSISQPLKWPTRLHGLFTPVTCVTSSNYAYIYPAQFTVRTARSSGKCMINNSCAMNTDETARAYSSCFLTINILIDDLTVKPGLKHVKVKTGSAALLSSGSQEVRRISYRSV